jgi:hypothetical protein
MSAAVAANEKGTLIEASLFSQIRLDLPPG